MPLSLVAANRRPRPVSSSSSCSTNNSSDTHCSSVGLNGEEKTDSSFLKHTRCARERSVGKNVGVARIGAGAAAAASAVSTAEYRGSDPLTVETLATPPVTAHPLPQAAAETKKERKNALASSSACLYRPRVRLSQTAAPATVAVSSKLALSPSVLLLQPRVDQSVHYTISRKDDEEATTTAEAAAGQQASEVFRLLEEKMVKGAVTATGDAPTVQQESDHIPRSTSASSPPTPNESSDRNTQLHSPVHNSAGAGAEAATVEFPDASFEEKEEGLTLLQQERLQQVSKEEQKQQQLKRKERQHHHHYEQQQMSPFQEEQQDGCVSEGGVFVEERQLTQPPGGSTVSLTEALEYFSEFSCCSSSLAANDGSSSVFVPCFPSTFFERADAASAPSSTATTGSSRLFLGNCCAATKTNESDEPLQDCCEATTATAGSCCSSSSEKRQTVAAALLPAPMRLLLEQAVSLQQQIHRLFQQHLSSQQPWLQLPCCLHHSLLQAFDSLTHSQQNPPQQCAAVDEEAAESGTCERVCAAVATLLQTTELLVTALQQQKQLLYEGEFLLDGNEYIFRRCDDWTQSRQALAIGGAARRRSAVEKTIAFRTVDENNHREELQRVRRLLKEEQQHRRCLSTSLQHLKREIYQQETVNDKLKSMLENFLSLAPRRTTNAAAASTASTKGIVRCLISPTTRRLTSSVAKTAPQQLAKDPPCTDTAKEALLDNVQINSILQTCYFREADLLRELRQLRAETGLLKEELSCCRKQLEQQTKEEEQQQLQQQQQELQVPAEQAPQSQVWQQSQHPRLLQHQQQLVGKKKQQQQQQAQEGQQQAQGHAGGDSSSTICSHTVLSVNFNSNGFVAQRHHQLHLQHEAEEQPQQQRRRPEADVCSESDCNSSYNDTSACSTDRIREEQISIRHSQSSQHQKQERQQQQGQRQLQQRQLSLEDLHRTSTNGALLIGTNEQADSARKDATVVGVSAATAASYAVHEEQSSPSQRKMLNFSSASPAPLIDAGARSSFSQHQTDISSESQEQSVNNSDYNCAATGTAADIKYPLLLGSSPTAAFARAHAKSWFLNPLTEKRFSNSTDKVKEADKYLPLFPQEESTTNFTENSCKVSEHQQLAQFAPPTQFSSSGEEDMQQIFADCSLPIRVRNMQRGSVFAAANAAAEEKLFLPRDTLTVEERQLLLPPFSRESGRESFYRDDAILLRDTRCEQKADEPSAAADDAAFPLISAEASTPFVAAETALGRAGWEHFTVANATSDCVAAEDPDTAAAPIHFRKNCSAEEDGLRLFRKPTHSTLAAETTSHALVSPFRKRGNSSGRRGCLSQSSGNSHSKNFVSGY